MKKFNIDKNTDVVCRIKNTRSGFTHIAVLLKNGEDIHTTRVNYINRTWESFEFQSVLIKLLAEVNLYTKKEQTEIMKKIETKGKEEQSQRISTIKTLSALSDVILKDKKSKNSCKKKLLEKTMKGIDFPKDWDGLSEEEKEKRLSGALSQL